MSAKTASTITLDDFYASFLQAQKSITKRFDKLDREVGTIGIVVHGLSTVVHTLAHDLKDLREYTEAGFDTMNNRFDYVDDRFDQMDKRMDSMDVRFDGMDDRFDAIDLRLDRVDDRFDRLESNFPGPAEPFYEH